LQRLGNLNILYIEHYRVFGIFNWSKRRCENTFDHYGEHESCDKKEGKETPLFRPKTIYRPRDRQVYLKTQPNLFQKTNPYILIRYLHGFLGMIDRSHAFTNFVFLFRLSFDLLKLSVFFFLCHNKKTPF